MLMYDNEFKTKEIEFLTKDKIGPQYKKLVTIVNISVLLVIEFQVQGHCETPLSGFVPFAFHPTPISSLPRPCDFFFISRLFIRSFPT